MPYHNNDNRCPFFLPVRQPDYLSQKAKEQHSYI